MVPAILVVLNVIIRSTKNWYYTVGSDIFLSLIAFNFSSIVVIDDVKEFIRNPTFKSIAIGVFPLLGLVLIGVWIAVVQKVETKVHSATRGRRIPSDLQFMVFLCWAAVVGFTGLEVLFFIWR